MKKKSSVSLAPKKTPVNSTKNKKLLKIVSGVLALISIIALATISVLNNQELKIRFITNDAFDELRLADSETASMLQLGKPISTDTRTNHYKNNKNGSANYSWIVESTYDDIKVNIDDLNLYDKQMLEDGWQYRSIYNPTIKELLEAEARSIHTPPYFPHSIDRQYTKTVKGKFDSINQVLYFKSKNALSDPFKEKTEYTPIIKTEYVKYINNSIFLNN